MRRDRAGLRRMGRPAMPDAIEADLSCRSAFDVAHHLRARHQHCDELSAEDLLVRRDGAARDDLHHVLGDRLLLDAAQHGLDRSSTVLCPEQFAQSLAGRRTRPASSKTAMARSVSARFAARLRRYNCVRGDGHPVHIVGTALFDQVVRLTDEEVFGGPLVARCASAVHGGPNLRLARSRRGRRRPSRVARPVRVRSHRRRSVPLRLE